MDTLYKSEKARPSAKASKKTPVTPTTDEVIFHDFDPPQDYIRTSDYTVQAAIASPSTQRMSHKIRRLNRS